MGDQDYSQYLDHPAFNLQSLSTNPIDLWKVHDIVTGLIQPQLPLLYPHFPYCMHSDQEEKQRCQALQEFVGRKALTVLSRNCSILGTNDAFPGVLLVSAITDILSNYTDDDVEALMRRSLDIFGFVLSETPDRRYRRLLQLLEEAIRDPDAQRRKHGVTVLEYCSEENMKTEKLIRLPASHLEESDLLDLYRIEFKEWLKSQVSFIEETLKPGAFLDPPCFEQGTFYESRLPLELLTQLAASRSSGNSRSKKPSRLDVFKYHIQAKACELRREGCFSAAGFMRDYYLGLRKQYYPELHRNDELTKPVTKATVQRKWLTERALDVFEKERHSW